MRLLCLFNQYLKEEEKAIQLRNATAGTVKELQVVIEVRRDRKEEKGMEGWSGNKTRSVKGEEKEAGADGGDQG